MVLTAFSRLAVVVMRALLQALTDPRQALGHPAGARRVPIRPPSLGLSWVLPLMSQSEPPSEIRVALAFTSQRLRPERYPACLRNKKGPGE